MHRTATRLLAGVLSGLFAGVVTGLILWGMWILPALSLLVTRTERVFETHDLSFNAVPGTGTLWRIERVEE